MSDLHKIPTKWILFYQFCGWVNKVLKKFKVNYPLIGDGVEKWTSSFWPQSLCVHNALQLYSNNNTQWRCEDTSWRYLSCIKSTMWVQETERRVNQNHGGSLPAFRPNKMHVRQQTRIFYFLQISCHFFSTSQLL